MKTQNIKLPRELNNWLVQLKRKLRKLKKEDANDIILSYTEHFYEQLREEISVNNILYKMRPMNEIIDEIYEQFHITNYKNDEPHRKNEQFKIKISAKKEPKTEVGKSTKISTMVFTNFLNIFVWCLVITFGLTAILLPIVGVFEISTAFISFDPKFASSIILVTLPIVLLLDVLFFFTAKVLFRTAKKLLNPFKKGEVKKIGLKLWVVLITITGIVSSTIAGVGVGTTYDGGFIDNVIHNKYNNKQQLLSFKAENIDHFVDKINQNDNVLIWGDENRAINSEMLKEYLNRDSNPSLRYKVAIYNRYPLTEVTDKRLNQNDEIKSFTIICHFNIKSKYEFKLSDLHWDIKLGQETNINQFPKILAPVIIEEITLKLPSLDWFNYIHYWQPKILEFVYE